MTLLRLATGALLAAVLLAPKYVKGEGAMASEKAPATGSR